MSQSADSSDGRAEAEATDWLIALQERPDDGPLRRRFESWRAECAANAAAWAATERFSALYLLTVPAHEDLWRPEAMPPPARRRPWRPAAGLPGLALAACLALLLLPDLMLRLQADHRTATGETAAITLDDGSTVHMAPDSAVTLALDGAARRVRLLAGEAFFEVAPDAARPFVVAAGDVTATVVGTAFDVRLGTDGTDVAVRQGIVRVDDTATSPPATARLQAGDWIRVAAGHTRRGHAPPAQVAGWLDGQLIARDRPVAEVVDDLRRYHAGIIVIADSALGRRPVTGVFDLNDPEAALRAVAAAHGAAVHRLSPWMLVLARR